MEETTTQAGETAAQAGETTAQAQETAAQAQETATRTTGAGTHADGETAVGLPAVRLDGDPPLGGGSSLDGSDAAAALRGHADGVATTVDQLATTLAEGDADPSELAAARTEASELLALLRELRVESD